MKGYLFDTCFLIDLEREMKRGPGKAHRFLQNNSDIQPYVAWMVAGEFAEGFGGIYDPACEAMLSRFDIFPMNLATAHHYAVVASYLRDCGQLIGTNDLWIAASAIANSVTLVTNNGSHFSRVPGLSVMGY